MRENRARIIFVCLAIAESCWVYAMCGVLGLVFGQTGSPLPWVAILLLLAAGMYTGWLAAGMRGDPASLAIVLGVAGLVAVYMAVAAGTWNERGAFDVAWAARLTGAGMDAVRWAGVILSLIVAVLLWRRAVILVTERYVEESMQRSFKLGIAVIAIALIAEVISGRDLGTRALLVPFFGLSLIGLAVGRLPEQGPGRKAGPWLRVIAVSVTAVVALGLVLGLAGGVYGGGGVRLIYRGWGLVVDTLLWLLRYPLEWLVTGMFAFWSWVRSLVNPSGETYPSEAPSFGPIAPVEPSGGAAGHSIIEAIVNILQYPALVLLLIGVFLFLALAFRRIWRRRTEGQDEDRERLEEGQDAAADMARLFRRLLPSWASRSGGGRPYWRYPEGEPGIGEVFRLYFDYLSTAIRRGMAFDPAQTPAERVPALAAALPGAPVELVTQRFNAACYGREPTDPEVLLRIREGLSQGYAGSA